MFHAIHDGVCKSTTPAPLVFFTATVFLLAVCWLAPAYAFEPVDCKTGRPHWSGNDPKVNLVHIFCGAINSRDKPVGFHARPGGENPVTARVAEILDAENQAGVYTAIIEIHDGDSWREKFSSLFPDRLDQREVVELILTAYKNSDGGQRWEGRSDAGFRIQGYEIEVGGETRINTAYPLYQR